MSVDDILYASIYPGKRKHRNMVHESLYSAGGDRTRAKEIFRDQLAARNETLGDEEIDELFDYCERDPLPSLSI